MILQYKNKEHDSWVYEEADKIECALIDFSKMEINYNKFNNLDMDEIELRDKYKNQITYFFNCEVEDIRIFADSLSGVATLTTISLTKNGKTKFYAFTPTTIYILNDNGKTINKIM